MFVWWYLELIGCLFVGIIYCQIDSNPLSSDMGQPEEEDVTVNLAIDTQQKSHATMTKTDSSNNQIQEAFACHECTNCNLKSDWTIRICGSDINMCYKIHKRINNTSRVIRRGCSTSKEQCIVPVSDQPNIFDSVTCCTSHKCNQSIQFKPLFFLSILTLFIMIII